jgi:hypothetical protein
VPHTERREAERFGEATQLEPAFDCFYRNSAVQKNYWTYGRMTTNFHLPHSGLNLNIPSSRKALNRN